MRYIHEWGPIASAKTFPDTGWYVMKGKTVLAATAEQGPFKTAKEAEAALLALEEPEKKVEKKPAPVAPTETPAPVAGPPPCDHIVKEFGSGPEKPKPVSPPKAKSKAKAKAKKR